MTGGGSSGAFSVIPLGLFPDTLKKDDGQQRCLKACKIYGLSGCQWHDADHICYARTEKISGPRNSPGTQCYTFERDQKGIGMYY